jgi:outer membrane receptor protein involved in Fe transport
MRARVLLSVSSLALGLQTVVAAGPAWAQANGDASESVSPILPTIVVTAPPRQQQKKRAKAPPRRAAAPPRTAPLQVTVPAVAPPEGAIVAAPAYQSDPEKSASEQSRTGARINAQPAARPGEVLETVPGLIVTQHSGEGKANQYFLRGFNLDHGTDLAITVDGMPVNMRTHGHGQGYADINFLIPELIASMRIRKGPYFADEGDFSSAGSLHIDYLDKMDPGLAQATAGMFGYGRALTVKSLPMWAGNLLFAGEAIVYDGPWDVADRVRKFNGVLRYSQGTADDGFSITGMAYSNRWTSTDQIPERAVNEGLISRFGSLDPTDGGLSSRYSLSSRMSQTSDYGVTRFEAYAIRSTLTLFNNFTYFLDDPVNGDQFSQLDERTVLGFHGNHTFKGRIGPFDSETRIGVQSRYDDIQVGLLKTIQRMPLATVRLDNVQQSSVGFYGQNTTHWTDWMRTIVGVREDVFQGKVASDTPENSGNATASIASPKFGLVLGPFYKTELFFNAGTGFHSNDVRGVTIKVDPADKTTPLDQVPFLVRAKGAEVGVRTKAIDGLESSVAVFALEYASELLFVGDAGTTEPSRPSRRVGIEWTNHYTPLSWLSFDVDIAYARARFTDDDPAGNHIPGAPGVVASVGVTFGEKTGWFGAAKLRYFGPRPLIEDGSMRSNATALVNARLGYRFDNGLRIQLDAYNLLNSDAHQIDYYYVSRLPGEAPEGIADRHFHPVEPLALRLTMAAKF